MYVPRRFTKRKITPLDIALLIVLIGGAVFVWFRIKVGLAYEWRWDVIPQYLFRFDEDSGRLVPNLLIQGLLTTVRLSIWSSVFALIIGLFTGILRMRKTIFPQTMARAYVEIVRNTPPLVLVFVFYFFIGNQITELLRVSEFVANASPGTIALINILFSNPARFSEFLSAIITLSIYEGAYIAEIIRSGIQSVDKGQWEASYSLGLSRYRQYTTVILPQAIRKILPALAGQFISAIKDSAIVSVISIQELTFQGLELMSATYLIFEVWITITVLYFILTAAASFGARKLESRLSRHLA